MLLNVLKATAWTMSTPKPYGAFHLCFAGIGIIVAIVAAYLLRNISQKQSRYLFWGIGIFLLLSEIYKQIFYFYIINKGSYEWWIFPFQLCSLPMYFCLLLPCIKDVTFKRCIQTFMLDFNLLGGLMTFVEPSGILHPYVLLTYHGFIWHILIIFLGLYIGFSGRVKSNISEFVWGIPCFFITASMAMIFNILFYPFGRISMFYISPYEPSTQIFFHNIALKWGIIIGIFTYLTAMCVGAFLVHVVYCWCRNTRKKNHNMWTQ